MKDVVTIAPVAGDPGLVAYECPDCKHLTSVIVLTRSDGRAAFERARVQGKQGRSPDRRAWLPGVAALVVFATTALILLWIRPPRPPGGPLPTQIETPDSVTVLKAFTPNDKPISGDLTLTETNGWSATCSTTQTFRLFEVANPGVERCVVTYRAKLKSENLVGRAYLEMWCGFPGQGEAFSRGLDNTLTGSNDWTTHQTPFFLKAGEKPELIRLNLVVEGSGKVSIKDIELLTAPLK